MLVNMYSIFDKKTGIYSTPFFQQNDATATRMFADEINGSGTLLSLHPDDFVLFNVGSWDDFGAVVGHEPVSVVDGLALKVDRGQAV